MRSSYWDAWKGVAILAVVGIHASGAALAFPRVSPDWLFGVILRQILDFPVPLFFALAGYFVPVPVAPSLAGPELATAYLRKRVVRLLVPYLIWSLLALLWRSPRQLVSPRRLAADLLLGEGIGVGYFVIALLQLVLLTPLLLSIRSGALRALLLASVTPLALGLHYYLQLFDPGAVLAQFPGYALLFPVWFMFFYGGLWLRQTSTALWSYRWLIAAVYCFFALAACVEGLFWSMQGLTNFGVSQIKATSFGMSGALFAAAVAWQRPSVKNKLLPWLGRRSYAIYLMHFPLLAELSQRVIRPTPLALFGPLHVASLSVLVLLTCAGSLLMVERVLGRQRVTRWLGA